jgi:hypothetical protein
MADQRERKPEQKFDANFRTIFRISKRLLRNKQKPNIKFLTRQAKN